MLVRYLQQSFVTWLVLRTLVPSEPGDRGRGSVV